MLYVFQRLGIYVPRNITLRGYYKHKLPLLHTKMAYDMSCEHGTDLWCAVIIFLTMIEYLIQFRLRWKKNYFLTMNAHFRINNNNIFGMVEPLNSKYSTIIISNNVNHWF